MLTLSEVSKSFGARTLFEGVSLAVNRGDRLGVVGANGAGKSTLFSLILGYETPDSGLIDLHRSAHVGHLPQESAPAGNETVLELAISSSADLAAQAAAPETSLPGDAANLQSHHAVHASWELEPKAKKILRGLGFRETDFERPARTISGGWVMRAHLARLLVHEPDLLLLDEPTNHLDLEALLWFQEYLKTYPGGILMISHDRDFLNELVTAILELRHGRVFRYRGNYDAFLEQREANEEQILAAWKNQQREIARLERFIERFRAKNTKATQAQSKMKQIERMEKVDAPQADEATIEFHFPQPQRSGLKVVSLQNVRFGYGGNLVYERLNFTAERGQRCVLVGPNGAGKSTLLKLLAGVIEPQAGERVLGHNAKAGYYSQYRVDTLHPDFTVLEEAFDTPQRLTETFVRTVLGSFLFRGDDVFKKVSVLSGGEKSRLALVKLLLDPPNLLLMDEPTTHLDLSSVDALLYALDQFEGTLVFISHDVYFIRSLANQVVHVKDGCLTYFPGDYQYYLDRTVAQRAAEVVVPGGLGLTKTSAPGQANTRTAALDRKEQKRLEAEERQTRYRERCEQRALVKRLETEITGLETRQHELTAELEKPETYQQSSRAVAINLELKEITDRLPQLTADWESAATRLAEMEQAD